MISYEDLQKMQVDDFDDHSAEELRTVLTNESLQKALAIIVQNGEEKIQGIVKANLENPEERAEATKAQGQHQAYTEIIETLISLAQGEE